LLPPVSQRSQESSPFIAHGDDLRRVRQEQPVPNAAHPLHYKHICRKTVATRCVNQERSFTRLGLQTWVAERVLQQILGQCRAVHHDKRAVAARRTAMNQPPRPPCQSRIRREAEPWFRSPCRACPVSAPGQRCPGANRPLIRVHLRLQCGGLNFRFRRLKSEEATPREPEFMAILPQGDTDCSKNKSPGGSTPSTTASAPCTPVGGRAYALNLNWHACVLIPFRSAIHPNTGLAKISAKS
jgi:hypothetical protein